MPANNIVTALESARTRPEAAQDSARLFTIKHVGDVCGLPGPVIMQLVPRTSTERRHFKDRVLGQDSDQPVNVSVLKCRHVPYRVAADGRRRLHSLHVLALESRAIAHVVSFQDVEALRRFDLPQVPPV